MDLVWYCYITYRPLGTTDNCLACILLRWYWYRRYHADLILADTYRAIPRLLALDGCDVLHIRNGTYDIRINIYQLDRSVTLLCLRWTMFRQLYSFNSDGSQHFRIL